MVTRRRFLTRAGGAVLGGTAAVLVGADRWWRDGGPGPSPDHRAPVSGRPVVEGTLASVAMGRTVATAVVRPPQPERGVVICLHGRGGDHRQAFDSMFLHDVVAEQEAPLALVAVDGGPTCYWHPRADGTDAMSLVLDELLPEIDRVIGAGLPLAVMGWSMGGYGALLLAERATDRFVAVAAASPALFARYEDATEGAFDGEADFAAHDVFAGRGALAPLTVRIDCGESDRFITQSRRFAAGLPGPDHGSFSPGHHDAAYWRSIAPHQIRTIVSALDAP
jgi:pimeloyl-ACP methyl ester carboxylesterase